MENNNVFTIGQKIIWNQSKTAREPGVNRINIWQNIKKHHIEIPAE